MSKSPHFFSLLFFLLLTLLVQDGKYYKAMVLEVRSNRGMFRLV